MQHEPFYLRIPLMAPAIIKHYLTLDALLSAALYRKIQDTQRAIDDIPLLQTASGLFRASSLIFEESETIGFSPSVAGRTGGLRGERDISEELFAPNVKKGNRYGKLDTQRGAFATKMDKYPAGFAPYVGFYGNGDAEQCAQLIQQYITGVGKRTNGGHGEIDAEGVEIIALDDDRSLILEHGPNRPIPLDLWREMLPEKADDLMNCIAKVTWRPPYWKTEPALCVVPDVVRVQQKIRRTRARHRSAA